MAVQHLKDRIPQFASRFEEGMDFHAEGSSGIAVQASRKGKNWKVRNEKTNLNGLIMDTGNVPEYIRNTMKKRGFSRSEADSWIRYFAPSLRSRQNAIEFDVTPE